MGRLVAFIFILAFVILPATCNRSPRDGLNGHDMGVNIEWLTDAQLSELGEVEGHPARLDKLRAFYDAMEPGDAKKTAAEKIVAECYNWVDEVAGEEGREELKRLHHEGHGKCKEKVAEFLAQIEDAEKKGQIEAKMPFCEHVWYTQHENANEGNAAGAQGNTEEGGNNNAEEHEHHHHRKRWAHRHPRDHFDEDDGEHEHENLEDYLQTHLSWLSDAQKEELREMRGQGKAAIHAKTMEFFEQSTGEQRAQAIRQLQSGCRELIRRIFGGEKAAELRQMREQGASMDEMEEKLKKMTDGLEDEGKREKVREFGPACRKIFAMNSAGRRRRDHHEGHGGHGPEGHEGHHGGHTLDDYYKTHLSWLTEAQREELKGMKGEGKSRAELQQKVMEWFGQLEGEEKEKAGELMKGGCRELIKALLGEEKAEEVRKMKEAGTEPAKISQKLDEWIGQLEEGSRKKQMALEYAPTCRRLFGVSSSRRRRDHHEGHHQGHHGQHSLEDYFRTHLAWLNESQKEEVKQMKSANKSRSEMQTKVLAWFDETEGETREKAVELMQGGCRELAKMVFGEEKATKLKEMRESGTEFDKIKARIEEWIAEIGDERKKALAEEYKPMCVKVFQTKTTRRLRDHHLEGHEGHHGGHTLDDYYKTHLSWLTEAQREELKGMKGEGKSRAELQQKVMEWFGQLEGEEKEKAGELMKGGCRELIKALLGEEKAEEVRKMKEAGTEPAKISQKLDEWIGQMEEGSRKKQMALEYAPTCRRLFGVESAASGSSRRRRSHHHRHRQNYRQRDEEEEEEVQLEEENRDDPEEDDESEDGDHHLDRHRSWLNRKQKKVLRGMKQRGHASHELHDKIHQFYEVSPDEVKATARGILQKGCEAILQRVFGQYKAEEIIQAKEEGASNAEMDEKIDEALAQIRNPGKREEAARFAMTCRRIFTMIERRRREVAPAEKTLEEVMKTHLSWLSDAQKEELNGMKDSGKGRTEMHQKVMEWFGQLEGEERGKALEKLRDGCRELLVFVLGKENADELRRMKETGTSETELEAKAQELIAAIGDEDKKTKAKEFGPVCKRIFLAN